MKVEKLNSADYSEIMRIWEDAVRFTHEFLSEKDVLFYKHEIFNKYLDKVSLFGVKQRGVLKGFLGVSSENIEMLFVEPACFGLGIGKNLVNYAIGELGKTKVDVNEQNERAFNFYKKLGFSVVSKSEFDSSGKPYPILHMSL